MKRRSHDLSMRSRAARTEGRAVTFVSPAGFDDNDDSASICALLLSFEAEKEEEIAKAPAGTARAARRTSRRERSGSSGFWTAPGEAAARAAGERELGRVRALERESSRRREGVDGTVAASAVVGTTDGWRRRKPEAADGDVAARRHDRNALPRGTIVDGVVTTGMLAGYYVRARNIYPPPLHVLA
mmetsp:Transcript_16533/g.47596  ORF Transcript_16533/g.47596 Transcript_16533/m.47596 type:complete len:186 (+) Transcript_16533:910-1467(+)